MDSNNVEWYVEGNISGYPAGDFGDALFDGLYAPTPLKKLRALADLYACADHNNTRLLQDGLPKQTGAIVYAYYHSEIEEQVALEELRHTLEVLPMLLVLAFPQLQVAIREYANRDPKGDQNGPV